MSVRLKDDIMQTRFKDTYEEFKSRRLSCFEAARILGISERTFLRKRERFEDEAFSGQWDLRLGKRPTNGAEDAEVAYLTKLYQSRYEGFSAKHFYGFYKQSKTEVGGPTRSYNWCRLTLQKSRLLAKSKRGGPHRQRRPRRPMRGMMLHQDASTHEWIKGQVWDLVVTMDDADSRITSMFFVDQEGTHSSLQGVKELSEFPGILRAPFHKALINDTDVKRNAILHQIVQPLLAHKLSVCRERGNLIQAYNFLKNIKKFDASFGR